MDRGVVCAHQHASLTHTVTVAILAQGTSWAVAVTQAFLLPGSILVKRTLHLPSAQNTYSANNAAFDAQLSVLSGPAVLAQRHPIHFPGCVGS